MNNPTGQRDIKSVVGVQRDCSLPLRLRLLGNNGERRTILWTSPTLSRQKTSSAFVVAIGEAFVFTALGLLIRSFVVRPGSLTSISESTPTRSSTLMTSASAVDSISNRYGPTS